STFLVENTRVEGLPDPSLWHGSCHHFVQWNPAPGWVWVMGKRQVMKNAFIAKFAVIALALTSAFSMGARAQTTEEGPAPSDQPSAPMEMGQPEESAQPAPLEAATQPA